MWSLLKVTMDRKNVLLKRRGVTVNDAQRFLRSGRNLGAILPSTFNPYDPKVTRLLANQLPTEHSKHVPDFQDLTPIEKSLRSIPSRLFRGGSQVENFNRRGVHRTALARIFPTGALDYDATAEQVAEVDTDRGTITTVDANQTVASRGPSQLPTVPWDRWAKATAGEHNDEHYVRPGPYIYNTHSYTDPSKRPAKVKVNAGKSFVRVGDVKASHANFLLNSGILAPPKHPGDKPKTNQMVDVNSSTESKHEAKQESKSMGDDPPSSDSQGAGEGPVSHAGDRRFGVDQGSATGGSGTTTGSPTPLSKRAKRNRGFLKASASSKRAKIGSNSGDQFKSHLPDGTTNWTKIPIHQMPNYSPVHYPGHLPGPVTNPSEVTQASHHQASPAHEVNHVAEKRRQHQIHLRDRSGARVMPGSSGSAAVAAKRSTHPSAARQAYRGAADVIGDVYIAGQEVGGAVTGEYFGGAIGAFAGEKIKGWQARKDVKMWDPEHKDTFIGGVANTVFGGIAGLFTP